MDDASGSHSKEATGAPQVVWRWSAFDELTLEELYSILELRQRVFVVEQACAYLDLDGADQKAWHLMGWIGSKVPLLAAYSRIFMPGVKFKEASIGRVITHPQVRRGGFGRELMTEAIRRTEILVPATPIRIGAQIHLERFYAGFGFRRDSEPYDEDGIMHIEMLRQPA